MLGGLEDITSAWVHWYNTSRLMHRLGRRPPAEAEAEYYAHSDDSRPAAALTLRGAHETRDASTSLYRQLRPPGNTPGTPKTQTCLTHHLELGASASTSGGLMFSVW